MVLETVSGFEGMGINMITSSLRHQNPGEKGRWAALLPPSSKSLGSQSQCSLTLSVMGGGVISALSSLPNVTSKVYNWKT